MSGVIVERRDQVLITGGRCPPERAFSTAFVMPLSINGLFLTERAISLHCRLPIADCRLKAAEGLKSAIGNQKSAIISSCDPSKSSSACACCCASCNRVSAGPTASPGFVHPKSCLHHHRAGGPPGSSPHHEPSDANLSNASGRLYQATRFRAR